MAIFYTDTGSLGRLEVTGSTAMSGSSNVLHVKGSGSAILVVSGSTGGLMEISDVGAANQIFVISSGSKDVLYIDKTQNVVISGSLTVDIDNITDVNSAGGFIGNKNGYVELYVQNLNSGISASTDIVAYSDIGTEASNFIDMGINGSSTIKGFSYGTSKDAYLYNTGGDLYIGNNTAYYQPGVASQSLYLFSNASGSPDVKISGSRMGIMKSGSLNATLDVNGSGIFSGSLIVSESISSPTINLLSNAISAVSTTVATVSALAPGGAPQVGLQNAINALSNRISAIPGGANSVNPTVYVSTANTLNTATLAGISGLTTSVSAGVIYTFEAQLMYSVSAATGNSFGLVWPTANRVAGQWIGSLSVNQTGASTFSTLVVGDFDTGDSNVAVWSSIVGATGLHFIRVNGIIDAQNTGAIYPVARSSAAANTLVIARGSFFRVARIN
jgi:hypothetical protein